MYFEDLKLGMERILEPRVIEKEKMTAFAREYDPIPLHLDEEYAKSTPFGGIIAPGVMSFMSVWAEYLKADFCGEELVAGRSMKLEWLKPVYAGDLLSGKARLSALTPRNERNGLVGITIDVFNQRGEQVMTSFTEAVVKRRKGSE